MLNQIKLVAKHTYLGRLKKKSFWGLILAPFLFILVSAGIGFGIAAMQSHDTAEIAVIAPANTRQALVNNEKDLNIKVSSIKDESKAKEKLNAADIDGVLNIEDDKGTLLTQPKSTDIVTDQLKNFLSKQALSNKAAKYNLTEQQIDDLKNPFALSSKVVEKNQKKDSDAASAVKQGLAFGIAITVFIIVSTYASIIGTEIANEKSSRIMETLLAASSARGQYFGKILGIAYLLLTQLGIYAALIILTVLLGQNSEMMQVVFSYFSALTPIFWLYTLFFVVVGTSTYLVIAAISASVVNDQTQISQAMMPITIISMIPYVVGISSSAAGNNLLVKILSYVPLVGQSLMPSQLANHYANWFEAIISLLLSVVFLVLVAWFGQRLYAKNVLSYSDENALKQLWKAMLPTKKSI
ncbi:ABC transporter permease [Fructobacillus sp. M2-14]|uniref:ABC transporter permease n=1 Tax=Fructobacillus broussonetiae TaxID=2713173 RepID=A0ABS5R049_9LACO|nr:ABC transporter permease [Fructobacillus broussonetiae]MBS9338741.1 ABC transporter permease [Fructobacillus broussonetiae]